LTSLKNATLQAGTPAFQSVDVAAGCLRSSPLTIAEVRTRNKHK